MEYQTMTASVISAVSGAIKTEAFWKTAGNNVREFFGSEAVLTESKAQFIADCILPAIDKRHAAALRVELVRKGSKEYNALDQSGKDKWEAANQAKKDARAVAHTMFARVVSYAFPKEKEPSAPRTLKTRFCEDIAALIKAGEKAEDADFDIVKCLQHLQAALAVAAK